MGTFAEYLDAAETNRSRFRESNPQVYRAFDVSVLAFALLADLLRDGRDINGRTHVSLAPLFFIFQRQAMAAYSALATNQAFLAWGLVRPGIEAALMIGKWVDDKGHADVWSNREANKKTYSTLFQGKGLQSAALPRSAPIQGALSRINDLFLHPNPTYYYRHLELKDRADGGMELKLNFFDDSVDMAVGVLGILHLVVFIQDALAEMFAKLFRTDRLDVGLPTLETNASDWARATMEQGPGIKAVLMQLGLWPDLTAV